MDDLHEYLEDLDSKPCISIVGDPRLSSFREKGFNRKQRKSASQQVAYLLKLVKPGKAYIFPNKGVNSMSIRLLDAMGFPVTIVNPYLGYCDKLGILDKLNLSQASKKYNVITVVGDTPTTLREEMEYLRETLLFIAERSQVVIYVHGKDRSPELKDRLDTIMSVGGGMVVCVNYDT